MGRKRKSLGWEYEGWDKSWINNSMYEVEEPNQANCAIMIDWSQQQMLSEEHKIQISFLCVRACVLVAAAAVCCCYFLLFCI